MYECALFAAISTRNSAHNDMLTASFYAIPHLRCMVRRYVALGMMHNEIAHWALPLPGLGGRIYKKDRNAECFLFLARSLLKIEFL